MNKLLDSLRELDYETWNRMYEAGFEDCSWPDALVQAEIQDVIRGRGWGCYQYHYRRDALEGDKKSEFAYISCTTLSHASADADTPAEAILAAYVAAMEVCNNAD